MRYIFTNWLFENAVKEIPLKSAKKCFSNDYNSYEIWEISEEDYYILDICYLDKEYANPTDLIWKDEWGWWRWCDGSSIEKSPTHIFTINSNPILLYYSESNIQDYIDCVTRDETDLDRWPYDGPITEEFKNQYFLEYGEFTNIFKYCQEIWGCCNETNVTAIITSNAKLNSMNICDFMKKVV